MTVCEVCRSADCTAEDPKCADAQFSGWSSYTPPPSAHEPTDPPWLTAALDAAGRGDFRAVADALTQDDE